MSVVHRPETGPSAALLASAQRLRAAVAGREIQEMRFEITAIQRANADLETRLAKMTSTAEMQRRAVDLGYRPVQPGELDYVSVPGFVVPEPEILLAAQDITASQVVRQLIRDYLVKHGVEYMPSLMKKTGS